MWNTPTQEQLSQYPSLYATEHIQLRDKIIHAHFFIGACDWLLAEIDEAGETCFGFVCLGDIQNAEWGYFSLSELKAININGIEIDFDLYWNKCPASEISTICKAQGWDLVQPGKQMANMTA